MELEDYQPRRAIDTETTKHNQPLDTVTKDDNDYQEECAINRAANRSRAEKEPAFAAFLKLNDIHDIWKPSYLDSHFSVCFVGEYATRDTIAHTLTDIGSIEDAIDRADFPASDVAAIDYDQLWNWIEQRWDIIWHQHAFYIFEK